MADNPLAYLSDKLVQVAYVVEDFEEAFAFFKNSLGIEKFAVWENITENQTEKIYRGQPGTFEFSAAYAYSGETQIELCKHISGNNVYKDWTDEKGIGIHHVGYLLDNEAKYHQAFAHLSSNFEVAMAGLSDYRCRWSYFDTRAILGSYTEIYWLPEEFKILFAKIKAGLDPFAED